MGWFALPAMVFTIAAFVAINGWLRRDHSPLFILRLFPAALLFVSLPAWLGAIDLARRLQTMATTGAGGLAEVAAMGLGITRPLLLGIVGAVLGASVAAALQAFGTGLAQPSDQPVPPHDRAETWLLLASALAVLPTAYLAYFVRELAAVIVTAGVALNDGKATATSSGMAVPELAAHLARQIVLAVTIGGAINLGLVLLTPAMLILTTSRRRPGAIDVCSWVVLVAVVGAGGWGAFGLLKDVRRFETLLPGSARPAAGVD